MTNHNVLLNMACPKCGSEGPFHIDVAIFGRAFVTDNGFSYDEIQTSEVDMPDDGTTICVECGHRDSTSEFSFGVLT